MTDETRYHTTQRQGSPVIRGVRAVASLREITTMDGFTEAPEMYFVLTQLIQVANVTGQVLEQANQWLRIQHRAGKIGTDNGGDVTAAIDALMVATASARSFATVVDEAASHASHLTGGAALTD